MSMTSDMSVAVAVAVAVFNIFRVIYHWIVYLFLSFQCLSKIIIVFALVISLYIDEMYRLNMILYGGTHR